MIGPEMIGPSGSSLSNCRPKSSQFSKPNRLGRRLFERGLGTQRGLTSVMTGMIGDWPIDESYGGFACQAVPRMASFYATGGSHERWLPKAIKDLSRPLMRRSSRACPDPGPKVSGPHGRSRLPGGTFPAHKVPSGKWHPRDLRVRTGKWANSPNSVTSCSNSCGLQRMCPDLTCAGSPDRAPTKVSGPENG
jgi:hypothetical protein